MDRDFELCEMVREKSVSRVKNANGHVLRVAGSHGLDED